MQDYNAKTILKSFHQLHSVVMSCRQVALTAHVCSCPRDPYLVWYLLSLRSLTTLWTTEPNRVVKFKKNNFFLFFAKNQCKYIGIGDIWPEQVGTSHFRAPMGPKIAILGSFSKFDAHQAIFQAGTRWNSPLKVKSEAKITLYTPKSLQNDQKWPILAISASLTPS